ncbi:MAG: hypothetical protein ACRDWN_05905 [Acidimicrobiales bacterium]
MSRGGRPRLYCSDAHRAEARRRRLGAEGGAAGEGDSLAGAADLLEQVVERLHRAAAPAGPDPALAEERARATAELLRAQELAASAARRAADAEDRLAGERDAWEIGRAEGLATLAEQVAEADELRLALEGAERALDEELLRHHADVAEAEERFRAQAAIERTVRAAIEVEVDRLRRELATAEGLGAAAADRLVRAEAEVRTWQERAGEVERRAAGAEVRSERLTLRTADLEAGIEEARSEVRRLAAQASAAAGERDRAVDQFRRHLRASSARARRSAGPDRRRRRSSAR